MSAISVKNLKKHFGKTRAVDGISFSVEKGEIFGFLGPNGAGKTTTIRCMMDFLRPTSGEIKILGLDAQKDSVKLKKKIGYLAPAARLYENWNAKQHFQFYEAIFGKSQILSELIKRFSLDQKILVHHLSSGNKQKVALILTFMTQPEIIILDEPTLGLDPILQNEVYKILAEFNQRGATIFMSSHNLPEVENICHRVGIIKDGKLVTTESIEHLTEKKIHIIHAYFERSEKKGSRRRRGPYFDKEDFDFDGVEVKEHFEDGLILNVKGNISPVIRKLSQYKLKDIEITHATLEDVFLEFYRK